MNANGVNRTARLVADAERKYQQWESARMIKDTFARFDGLNGMSVYINLTEVSAAMPVGDRIHIILKSGQVLQFDNVESVRTHISSVMNAWGGFKPAQPQ